MYIKVSCTLKRKNCINIVIENLIKIYKHSNIQEQEMIVYI